MWRGDRGLSAASCTPTPCGAGLPHGLDNGGKRIGCPLFHSNILELLEVEDRVATVLHP
jgi:hypothetical protein